MKQIESGCLALIIDSDLPECGKIVTVIKPIQVPIDFIGSHQHWLIDRFITQLYENDNSFAEFRDIASSDQLMRIDGESFTEDKELMEIEQ